MRSLAMAFATALSLSMTTLPAPWESSWPPTDGGSEAPPQEPSPEDRRYRDGYEIPYLTPNVGIHLAPMVPASDALRTIRCRDAKVLDSWLCR